MGCCFSVQQAEVGIIERCGAFSRLAQPGCHCVLPFCDQLASRQSLRIHQMRSEVESKTSDNVFVTIHMTVQYKVDEEHVYDAYYSLADPAGQITTYVQNAIRDQVPRLTLDQLFHTMNDVAANVKTRLEAEMGHAGYQVVSTLVTDVEPDRKVKDALNEINTQDRLRQAAEAKAEAAKITLIKAAEAEAETKRLSGVGVANQRAAIVDGLAGSIRQFTQTIAGVEADEVMQLILLNQYFDTLKDVANNSRSNTVFLNHSPAALGDLSAQITQGMLAGQAAKPKTA